MKQITKEWLNRAKDDIDVIESILDKKHLTNMVAFHSQQLVEKCFKAVIEEYEINFIKIHNLETLFGRIKQIKNFKIDLNVLKC